MDQQIIEPKRHIILIDGYNFVFRAYHALPPLTRADGTAVGAVYGFTSMLIKLLQDMKASHVAVVFDTGVKSFRNDIYPDYKAHRPEVPEDLKGQFQIIREAARAFNLPVIEQIGYEADDVIATIARLAREAQEEVTIVSSDKDLMQLIGPYIRMFDPIKSKIISDIEVQEKYGVTPKQLQDLLALVGDSSDNIPGVAGIGMKTATELINSFGSLEQLLARSDQISQPRRRTLLADGKEKALLSYKLLTLDEHVPITVTLNDLQVREKIPGQFFEFLDKYGFKSLAARAEHLFGSAPVKQVNAANGNHLEQISDANTLVSWLEEAYRTGVIAVYLDVGADGNGVIELCIRAGKSCKLSLGNSFDINQPKQQSLLAVNTVSANSNIVKALAPILNDQSILKIVYDAKKLRTELANKYNLITALIPYDDILLLSYTASNGLHEHKLEKIGELYFGDLARVGAELLLKAHTELRQQLLKSQVVTVYERIERPLTQILYAMEQKGVKIDAHKLLVLSNELAARLVILEQEIYKEAKGEFNIGSPKQLADVLFNRLGFNAGKPSAKSGAQSTSADVLEELRDQGVVIAGLVLEWRQLAKLKNTYTDALPKQINPLTGRVHTCFSMAATSTGRLSSSEPNLQNIPIRTEEGNKIRAAFVAEPGYKLISADYSQIELRILAHMADIDSLKKAFLDKRDIHAATASQIFGIPIEQIDANTRRKAKAINFGIIYGISSFGLAKQLSISRSEAANYIQSYFREYPGIEAYMEKTKEFARTNGYVSTLLGRKCYIKTINDKNHAIKSFAERAAINAPIQGTAADIIKKAMVEIYDRFNHDKLRSNMILQVHDELLFEVPSDEIEVVKTLVKQIMENIVQFDVPLTVDIGVGDNWSLIHK